MAKRISSLISAAKGSYNWSYCSLGGVVRVNITSGQDIAHLGELPQTMWTVLSCPVKGLELDERTLQLMDTDNDGKIRVDEVVGAAKWLCRVLKSPDLLIPGHDVLNIADINEEDPDGAKLREYAEQVIKVMGLEGDTLSLTQLKEFLSHYDDDCKALLEKELGEVFADEIPYGDNTEAALAAVMAIKDKMADYFMRCKFVQFHDDCTAALDVSVDKVAAISENNLATCVDEISKYPISRPIASALLPLHEGINPAWQAAFKAAYDLTIAVDYPNNDTLSEDEWNAIVSKLDAYSGSKSGKVQLATDAMTTKVSEQHDFIRPLEKLLHLMRDFYTLLRNYVMMSDFYSKDHVAIFEAGRLFIDSRCCNLCLKVTDMAAHADMTRLSGMYLIYCKCVSKVKNETMDIVAVMTDGDIDNLRVGKNAIFYDRQGLDWDAIVTKIIDNPISVRQAFWSPYKKFWNWCTEKLNKSAQEKEAKQFENMTAGVDNLSLSGSKKDENSARKQAFDIAKFAGIFAAIGMAVAYLTGALEKIVRVAFDSPLSLLLFLATVILVISGPSMFIAWSKLRKRNLGPVLNANGWAINAKIVVNVRFGTTLTGMAQYPKIVFEDPYAAKKMPKWKRIVISITTLLVAVFIALYFTNCFGKMGVEALTYDKEHSVVNRTLNKVSAEVAKTGEQMVSALATQDSTTNTPDAAAAPAIQ